MLEELDQVKHFIIDIKDAYETERNEWHLAKEDFQYQIQIREKIWNENNEKLLKSIAKV